MVEFVQLKHRRPKCRTNSSLSVYARVNSFGLLKHLFQVKNGVVLQTQPAIYLTADEEDKLKIAPADTQINENGLITQEQLTVRYHQEFIKIPSTEVQLIAVSTVQIISSAAALIPFLEHDEPIEH